MRKLGCSLEALQHTTGLQSSACLGGNIALVDLRVTGWLVSKAGLAGVHALQFSVPACFCSNLADILWTSDFRLQCNVRLDLSRGALAAQLRIWIGAWIMCSNLVTNFRGRFLSSAPLDRLSFVLWQVRDSCVFATHDQRPRTNTTQHLHEPMHCLADKDPQCAVLLCMQINRKAARWHRLC